MWIQLRVPQRFGHPFHQLVRGGVFESFGLRMHPVPRVTQSLDQVRLDHAVPAYDPQRLPLPLIAQFHPVVRPMGHQAQLGEVLDHVGDRGGRAVQVLGKRRRAHRRVLLLQTPDCLEVVFHGTGAIGRILRAPGCAGVRFSDRHGFRPAKIRGPCGAVNPPRRNHRVDPGVEAR